MVLTLLMYLYTNRNWSHDWHRTISGWFYDILYCWWVILRTLHKNYINYISKVMRQLLMYYLLLLQWYFNILKCWQSEYKMLSWYVRAVWFHITRLLAEIDEVLDDKDTVTADDLNQLKYTEQVIFILLRVNIHI